MPRFVPAEPHCRNRTVSSGRHLMRQHSVSGSGRCVFDDAIERLQIAVGVTLIACRAADGARAASASRQSACDAGADGRSRTQGCAPARDGDQARAGAQTCDRPRRPADQGRQAELAGLIDLAKELDPSRGRQRSARGACSLRDRPHACTLGQVFSDFERTREGRQNCRIGAIRRNPGPQA
jgi:hypothetical protein